MPFATSRTQGGGGASGEEPEVPPTIWDDMNRSVDAGLDVATNGTAWTTGSGSATVGVDGDEGWFTSATTDQTKLVTWNADDFASAPWWDWALPGNLRSTTMRARFRFDFDPPGPGQGFVRLVLNPGNGTGEPLINISNSSGNYGFSGGSPGSISKLDWMRGHWYIAEWVYDHENNDTTTFVVYEEGTTPGTLSVMEFNFPGDSTFPMSYANEASAGARPIFIDYIDFT